MKNETFFTQFWVVLFMVSLLLSNTSVVFAQQSRGGGNVKVKDEATGKVEEVKLYKGSYALVIGMSDYTNGWQKLEGVKTDVPAIAEALAARGFEITKLLNPKKAELVASIEKFINDHGYDYENRLLIYYAGHGHTQKSGAGFEQGFIVPVDAPIPTAANEAAFRRTAISMDAIERYAGEINAKHALFVFDSCFSGALITKTRSGVPSLITTKTTQPVRQFITAGADSEEVPDISEFRKQFVLGIGGEADRNADEFVTASELADFLQDKVSRYTKGAQTPQYGKIRDARLDKGDFVFSMPSKKTVAAANNPIEPETVITAKDAAAIEREAWNDIKTSRSAVDFRAFLEEYPAGKYAAQARIRLEEIAWESIKTTNDIAKVKNYLTEFPNGANAGRARIKLRQIEAGANTANPITPSKNEATNSAGNNSAAKTAGAVSKSKLPNNLEMSFAYVPAGNFQMGSANGYSYEQPVHKVIISKGFWMGQTEVTQAQWAAVMGNFPSSFKGCSQCPVESVSWEDAQQFISQLNAKNDGNRYRLPTEAEWEYAARAGTTGDYAGNFKEMAWYEVNSGYNTHEVGTKQANGWGLFDMHGNVWEWVQDWEGNYSSSDISDPTGKVSGGLRIKRGGGWHDAAANCRSAFRSYGSPGSGSRDGQTGFRLVRQEN